MLELSGASLKQTACQSAMLATSVDHTRSTIGSQSMQHVRSNANLTEHITLNNTQIHALYMQAHNVLRRTESYT